MTGLLLDASVVLAHLDGRVDWHAGLDDRADVQVFVSPITVSELLQGVYRADTPEMLSHGSAFVEALLERVPVLPIDRETSRAHALLWADLAARGEALAPHDLWLAASCVAHGLALAVDEGRDFARVPGLSVTRLPARESVRGRPRA